MSRHQEILEKTVNAYRKNLGLFKKRLSQAGGGEPPFRKLVSSLLPEKAVILDLGCGEGEDALAYLKQGFFVTGIDATPEFITESRRRCRGFSRRARFDASDMMSLSLPSASFDAVWANASLIHLARKDARVMMKRIRRWLRPGGLLAATIHQGKDEGFRDRTWIPGRYFASWLKDELAEATREAGFEIVHLKRVFNEDRKGRWLNLVARKPSGSSR